jgi:pimeloyl-ACP methyl ester carboxylesterase
LTPSLYQNDLFVLIHGLSSSKDEWFNNHKRLSDYFILHNIPFIALDLYGHGGFAADEPDFSTDYINDDLWPVFIDKSVNKFTYTISLENEKRSLKRIHIISYSVGSVIGIELAKRLTKCTSLSLCVPNPDYSINDEYSLCNTLEQIKNKNINILSGTNDNEIEYKEIEKLIKDHKYINHHSYNAGHILPDQWIDDLLNDFE